MLFCLFYLISGKVQIRSRFLSIAFSSLCGLTAFFLSGFALSVSELYLGLSLMLFIAAYLLNIMVIRKMKIVYISPAATDKSNTLTRYFIRGLFSAAIIVAITGAASVAGAKWSGILSAFPSTTYSLLLVLHFESGDSHYPSIINGFSFSVSTLAVFYVLMYALLPMLGLNMGFAAAYIICIVYLFAVKFISDKICQKDKALFKNI
jgi:hypothetical protein